MSQFQETNNQSRIILRYYPYFNRMSDAPSQDTAPTLQDVHIKMEKEEDIKLEDTSQPSLANSSIKRESFKCGFCAEYLFYEKYFLEHIREHHSKAPVTVATKHVTIATTRATIATTRVTIATTRVTIATTGITLFYFKCVFRCLARSPFLLAA